MKLKSPSMPYKEMMVEISNSSGIGRNSIASIISEYKKTGNVTSPIRTRNKKCLFDQIDDLDRNALRQKVHSFWLRKELPTIDKILHAVNEDPSLPDFKRTSLYSVIKKLDFVFTKRKRCSVLTEREDLLLWRQNYLYDVRKYREEGRTVYYLDETWLTWLNPTGKGKRLILLHIGSHKGFLDGGLLIFESKKNSADYHDEINGDKFHEWFESILPRLDPNSVIVMDNAPFHSVRTEKIPTSNTTKAEILSWLISKNVVIDRPMYKPQLLAKVREIKGQYMSYVVDNMAKDAGHNVLRLPPYHCELNPIELAWAMVKGYVKQHNTTYEIDDVKVILNTAIERVTSVKWQNFLQHVKTEEDKMTEVDNNMDEIIDNLEPCVISHDRLNCTITGDTSNSEDDL